MLITKFLKTIATMSFLFLALSACSKDDSSEKATEGTEQKAERASAAQHAAADVVPGSHADWCGEHGVAESQCTRCNPALVAAFKATGDWCDEHGVPESQCKKCDPELDIVRPPPPASGE